MSFYQNYEICADVLGTGQFATVKRCIMRESKQQFAVKIIDKSRLKPSDEESLKLEIEIGTKLDHPNLVRLHHHYLCSNMHYLVCDLVQGGELFEDIVRMDHYSEQTASGMLRQILRGVNYCHQNGIIHRDLKPENILLTTQGNATIKIADFGLAIKVTLDQEKGHFGFVGTPMYIAPEILKGEQYGKAVDVWGIGVILYIMLVGYPPFWEKNQTELFLSIILGQYHFKSPEWDSISIDAKELIVRMLDPVDDQRLTAAQVLEHKWLVNQTKNEHRQETIESMRQFNAKRKMKAAMTAVMATNILRRVSGSSTTSE